MKNKALLMIMSVLLSLASLAFASDGKDIDAQQRIVDTFMTGKSYAAVKPFMAPEMAKSFTEQQYTEMFAKMEADMGKLMEKDMMVFQKLPGGDVLRYAAKYEKGQVMQIIAAFKGENGKFQLFDISVFPAKAEADKAAAKK